MSKETGYPLPGTREDIKVGIDVIENGPTSAQEAKETPAELTPEEAFAQHIAEVRERGDPIDYMSVLRWKDTAARGLTVGAASAEAAVIGGTPFGVVAGVVSAAAVLTHHAAKKKDEAKRAESRDGVYYQEAVGQQYELYTPKSVRRDDSEAPLDLVWYGPAETMDDTPARTSMLAMAKLAKSQGIGRMHVDVRALETVEQEIRATLVPRAVFPDELLKELKGLEANRRQRALASFTPDEWIQRIEDTPLPGSTNQKTDTFVMLAEKLAEVRPEHPLVRIVAEYQDDPETLRQVLQRAAGRSIERRLERVDFRPSEACRASLRGEDSGEGPRFIRRTDAHYQLGAPRKGETVQWNTTTGYETQDINDALDVTAKDEALLAKHPELDPPKAESVLELALYKAAHQKPVRTPNKEVPEDYLASWPIYHPDDFVQKDVVRDTGRRVGLAPHRRRQALAGLALAVVATVGVKSAHDTIDSYRDNQMSVIKQGIAQQEKKAVARVSDGEAEPMLHTQYPELFVWDGITKGEEYLSDAWEKGLEGLAELAGKASKKRQDTEGRPKVLGDEYGVGNAALPDTPVFNLEAHGGMSTEGYWAAGVSRTVLVKTDQHNNMYLNWSVDPTNIAAKTDSFPASLPAHIKEDGKWIKVERTIPEGELATNENAAVNIPVLEGTEPVAANIDGESRQLITRKGNTYAIDAGDEEAEKLTYWLAPKTGNKPRNIGELYAYGDNLPLGDKNGQKWLDFNKTELSKQLMQSRQMVPGGNPEEVVKSWEYSTMPFKGNTEFELKSYKDFVEAAVQSETANCNTANTLIALSNPDSSNAVVGFMNASGDGSETLAHSESHMWRTDGDATPIGMGAAESGANNGGLDYELIRNGVAGAGLIGLGGVAIAAGMRTGGRYSRRYHTKNVSAVQEHEDVYMLQAAAEVVLYGGQLANPKEAAQKRAAELAETRSPEETMAAIASRPDLNSDAVLATLKEAARSEQDPAHAARLKAAMRALNSVRQTAPKV